jgi:hypothetical protein
MWDERGEAGDWGKRSAQFGYYSCFGENQRGGNDLPAGMSDLLFSTEYAVGSNRLSTHNSAPPSRPYFQLLSSEKTIRTPHPRLLLE